MRPLEAVLADFRLEDRGGRLYQRSAHGECFPGVAGDRVRAMAARISALEGLVTAYDNLVSTIHDHLPLCVGDGDFADASQDQVARDLLTLRALRREAGMPDGPASAPPQTTTPHGS